MIETVTSPAPSAIERLRENCQGVLPLRARLSPWMQAACHSDAIHQWIAEHGSPLNLICTEPLQANIADLNSVATGRQLDFRVYFARKANKCLSLVDAAVDAGAGIDTASLVELQQVLDRDIDPAQVICTAAIKDDSLLTCCVNENVTIAIDNEDELWRLQQRCRSLDKPASIAIRISGFHHSGEKLTSRFGFDIDQVAEFAAKHLSDDNINVVGIHFHLDGYDADQRVSAITQSLDVVDSLRAAGHNIQFLDIGGGFPMCYLESAEQWRDFWDAHKVSLLGERSPITFQGHGLGYQVFDGKLHGKPNLYPYYQQPVQADWLAAILDTTVDDQAVAAAIRGRNLQLRCEPGRSVLDGCGATVARVEFRKQRPDGDWLIGLSMNGTQCRTSSDDFLVDPILLPSQKDSRGRSSEGYLVGAYCMESELLLLRKLCFPQGVNVGDLFVFPNTAGYLMHFMESRSHQFPLAKNLIVSHSGEAIELDAIDC